MKVRIVIYEEEPWILSKFAQNLYAELKNASIPVSLANAPDPSADINHHFCYWDYEDPIPTVETTMVTHINLDEELACLRRQLLECGVEMGVCMSHETRNRMISAGLPSDKLCVIGPAHDGVITPRSTRIGLASRIYPDGRKREHFLREVVERIDPAEFSFSIMGEGWDDIVERMRSRGFSVDYFPEFERIRYANLIRTIDYYLYPGNDEGSMAFLDALAAGVPTIVTRQGFHLDVPGGITHGFETLGDLMNILESIASVKRERAATVAELTWKDYARRHLYIWDYLLRKRDAQPVPDALLREISKLGLSQVPD